MNPIERTTSTEPPRKHGGQWKLVAVIALCAAPVLASYVTYYVIKPQQRTNYGALLDPKAHPIPALNTTTLDGSKARLEDYHGKWIMLLASGSECEERCKTQLFAMRQLRLMQGKEMDRIERVWMVTDRQPVDTTLIREYEGMRMLRVDDRQLEAWLPKDAGTTLTDHIYIVDPLGNLMMRFPKYADPARVKKDIARLLQASRIG